MLIAILGTPYAGKDLLAQELVETHHYTRVHIASSPPPHPLTTTTAQDLYFTTSSHFLDYATQYWRKDFVTTDLRDKTRLEEFAKRPFVALVAVEAPLGIRFNRAIASAQATGTTPPTLQDFVALDDLANFGTSSAVSSPHLLPPTTPQKLKTLSSKTNAPPSPTPSPPRSTRPALPDSPPLPEPLALLLPLVHHTFVNPFSHPAPFFASIHSALLGLSDTLRPPWDTYFMHLATLASLRSNCMKRRVGAVLVRERRVVSTGYNGTPRNVTNCNEGGCKRCNSYGDGKGTGLVNGTQGSGVGPLAMGVGLDECLCLHAEENALLEAGRERVSGGGTPGAVLYCNTCPCLRCTVKIVQCGVTEVVYSLSYSMDDSSRRVMEEAGILVRQIEMPETFSRA